ncbi:hypothetical protein LCGC14_0735200 [marine sediment metagenome]|uniref:Toprim domain-containing protein n=1 Tax=marine sediment metagenome TaxID=412755 RepID=A0A0F9Q8C3_9ZZZZ
MNTQLLIETLEGHNHKVRLVEGDTELVIACPLCFSEKQKLYVEAATGLWTCFLCDEKGGLNRLLRKVCDLSYQEAIILEQEIRGGDEKKPTMVVSRPPPPSSVELPPGFQLECDTGANIASDYLVSRKLNGGWVADMGIGYCLVGKYHHRVIVPIWTQGFLRTFVARTWLPNEKKKVLMPEGSQAERALYGYDWLMEENHVSPPENLILVEGVFDAIRMWQLQYPDTLATLGAHLTELQRALVKQLKPKSVVLLRDGDTAGRKAAIEKEGRELAYDMLNVSIASLPAGTDPCSVEPKDIRRALDEARPITVDYGIETQKEVHQ